jgi:hypothetical protein
VLRSPVINAHLVRRSGSKIPVGLGGAGVGARRGRAKTKKRGTGDSGGSPIDGLVEGASEQQLQQEPSTSWTSTVEGGSPTTPIVGRITNHPTLSISPASTTASTSATLDFKLKDTGPLSVSWGE